MLKNIKNKIKSVANQNDQTDNVISMIEQEFALGSEIRQMRKARQLTLKNLASLAGISVSHISAIERGATNPSLNVIKDIASALKIDPNWFLSAVQARALWNALLLFVNKIGEILICFTTKMRTVSV